MLNKGRRSDEIRDSPRLIIVVGVIQPSFLHREIIAQMALLVVYFSVRAQQIQGRDRIMS